MIRTNKLTRDKWLDVGRWVVACSENIGPHNFKMISQRNWLVWRKFHHLVHQLCHSVCLEEWKNISWCQKYPKNRDLIFCPASYPRPGDWVELRGRRGEGSILEIFWWTFVLNYVGVMLLKQSARHIQVPGVCPDTHQNTQILQIDEACGSRRLSSSWMISWLGWIQTRAQFWLSLKINNITSWESWHSSLNWDKTYLISSQNYGC